MARLSLSDLASVDRPLQLVPVRSFSNARELEQPAALLANAVDDEPADLPHLLRRLADAIEEYGINPDNLLDVTVSSETTSNGPWWSATVYWSADAPSGGCRT